MTKNCSTRSNWIHRSPLYFRHAKNSRIHSTVLLFQKQRFESHWPFPTFQFTDLQNPITDKQNIKRIRCQVEQIEISRTCLLLEVLLMRYTRVCVDSLESMPEIMSIYKYRLLVINRDEASLRWFQKGEDFEGLSFEKRVCAWICLYVSVGSLARARF